MDKCDIKGYTDEFIEFYKESGNFIEDKIEDPLYYNYLIIVRFLNELRTFELDTKDDMYEYIDDFIKHDKSAYMNTNLKAFFDKFKEFYNILYHDVCYSEAAYINNDVYGEAYYSIDKDFILNKVYKNEYKECSDMYSILQNIVPEGYVDLVFEDFLYTILKNSGLMYHSKKVNDNIHYQISYSNRVVGLANEYLDLMVEKIGEEDISNEPDLRDYIRENLKRHNSFVSEEKGKQLKR